MKKVLLKSLVLLMIIGIILSVVGCENKKTTSEQTSGEDDFFTDTEVQIETKSNIDSSNDTSKDSANNKGNGGNTTKTNKISGKS